MAVVDLTEDETALYDRQIRLWGIESQRRLRTARILIIGVRGLGAEVAKNIILTGVKSVTLLDAGVVTQEDQCAQFLAPPDSIGRNRAEASQKRAQALNPMVKVTADTEDIDSKPDEYFSSFDLVFATGCNLNQLRKINTACRYLNVKFFCGDVYGMFGFGFADLLEHEYIEEVTHHLAKGGSETLSRQKVVTYTPLSEVISLDWSDELLSSKLRKMDYLFFLMLVLFEFRKQNGRVPDRMQRENDINALKELAPSVLSEINVPSAKIPDSIYEVLFAEVSPVCAIVGGVLAQDIIRAASCKEKPLCNFFFFNPEKCYGYVENIGIEN